MLRAFFFETNHKCSRVVICDTSEPSAVADGLRMNAKLFAMIVNYNLQPSATADSSDTNELLI